MTRPRLLGIALLLSPLTAIVAACAASPGEEPQPPIVVSTEGDRTGGDNPDPALARQAALEQAETAGILGLLDADAGGSTLANIFGTDEALGTDLSGALGGLTGDTIGEAFGAGGLGLRGTGAGAGGTGEGIGLGSIGTIGHGSGTGTGQGYGSGAGRLGGTGRSSPPTVRAGDTNIQGSLPREVIQRIVRRHMAQLRYCYEKELVKDPKLEGRVVVRFVIDKQGAVTNAQTSGDMPDANVRECVARVFMRMSFPTPDPAGIVVVSYPLVFSPGEADAAKPPSASPSPAPKGSSAPGTPTAPAPPSNSPSASPTP